MFVRRVTKYGNSLSCAIPKSYLEELQITRGDLVYLSLNGRSIVISKLDLSGKKIEKLIKMEEKHG